jgi:rubrerythrin
MNPIRTAPELYAHAMAIEQEAAGRYAELAERMSDQGNEAVAEIFGRLAQMEAEHLEALRLRTREVALPQLAAGQYNWLQKGPPETAARELIFRLMTPRNALAIALSAEKRAQAFFEHAFMTADDPALRALAREMAAEEGDHIAMVERLLDETPESNLDSLLIFAKEP